MNGINFFDIFNDENLSLEEKNQILIDIYTTIREKIDEGILEIFKQFYEEVPYGCS